MIRNRALSRTLFHAAQVGRHAWMRPVNQLAQVLYLKAFTPLFERYLNGCIEGSLEDGRRIRLVARHSILTRSSFRVFESDIDYSLVFSGELKQQEISLLKHQYDRARERLPFIGELEIYSDEEFDEKSRIARAHGPLLSTVRALRKWRWQKKQLQAARTAYHRAKAEAAIARIKTEFGVQSQGAGISAEDSRQIGVKLEESVLPAISARDVVIPSFFSKYLDWKIITTEEGHSGTEEAVSLSPLSTLALLSILPDGTIPRPELEGEIQRLRLEPEVQQRFQALCRDELLTLESVLRVSDQDPGSVQHWRDYLRKILGPASLSTL